MKYLIILALTTILYSCGSQQKCYPSKRSRDYAVIKTDGNLIKHSWKATLISMKKTFKGYKLVFISGEDTIVRFSPCPEKVGECYYVLKS